MVSEGTPRADANPEADAKPDGQLFYGLTRLITTRRLARLTHTATCRSPLKQFN